MHPKQDLRGCDSSSKTKGLFYDFKNAESFLLSFPVFTNTVLTHHHDIAFDGACLSFCPCVLNSRLHSSIVLSLKLCTEPFCFFFGGFCIFLWFFFLALLCTGRTLHYILMCPYNTTTEVHQHTTLSTTIFLVSFLSSSNIFFLFVI